MTCLAVRYVPVRFTAITRAHSSAGSMWTGPPPATPGRVDQAVTAPPKSTAARTSAATESSSVTSTWVKAQRPDSSLPSGTSSGGTTRSAPMTRAPSSRSRAAVARPMPDAAPVTM